MALPPKKYEYTAEDFLTPAPYEQLYSYVASPFIFQTETLKMAERAKEVRFSGFKDMLRKYIDAQGRWLIHGIASQFQVELDHELEKLRDHHTPMFKHLKIIRELHPMAAIPDLRQFTPEAILTPLEKVQVHASCDSIKDCAYFILRLAATSHINTH